MNSSSQLSPIEYQAVLRQDLVSFVERSFRELNPETAFIPSPYVELLAMKLEQCRRRELRRLIVNIPPRSLKSHTVSVAFAAWLLGHDPASQIICASYGQDLADKHARDCRTLMASEFYRRIFPATLLSANKQSVNEFHTTRQGCRMSTSVGGVLTGRGADFIIVDDPLKPDDAMSESRRTSVNDWFDNSLLSRLNDKNTGVIIIVMQRLHMDDLVGHVTEQGGWEALSLPAIAIEDVEYQIESVLGTYSWKRRAGEVLHPERESMDVLTEICARIGEYNFSAQYQQCPIPREGAIIKSKWLKYYDPKELSEEFSHTVQSWDTANKAGELNDCSVCTTWGVREKQFYLLDVFRARLEFPALKRNAIELAEKFRPSIILIEDKASGTQLAQELKFEGVYQVRPHTPPPGNDKVLRLHNQTVAFENGLVLLPNAASWLADYLKELLAFPGHKHDDQVDSTTQALEYLTLTVRKPSIYEVL